jgi:hypothetical protein
MTPSRLLDFSSGGTVQVSISTAKLNNRDWLDFWISPFSENLLLPSGGVPPDLQGPTKDALLVQVDASIPSDGHVQEFRNYASTEYNGTGLAVEACVAPLGGVSTARRDPFLLTMSRTHVKLDLLVNGVACTLIDTNIADLGFGVGVVQLGHHSYAPDEGTMCNIPGCSVITGAGAGNTWHWSNFSMSPAIPFTMLRGDMAMSGVQANTSPTVNFAGAAPANSFLRFSGQAKRGSIQISANGGAFFPAQEQMQKGDGVDGVSDGAFISFWTPIPAGTTRVTFKALDSIKAWAIQDVAIWSSDQASITPIPLPAPPPGGGGGATGGGTTGGGTTGGGTTTGGGSTVLPGEGAGVASAGDPEMKPGGGSGNPLEGGASQSAGADEHAQTGGASTGQPQTGGPATGGAPAEQPSTSAEAAEKPSNGLATSNGARSTGTRPGTAVTVLRDDLTAMVRKEGIQSALPWILLLLSLLTLFGMVGSTLGRRARSLRRMDRRRLKK